MNLRTLLSRQAGGPGAGETDATRPGHGEFDGIAAHYDHLMRKVPYSQWVDYIEAVLARRDAKPKSVLDLCCGTGKVGSEFAGRGYDVVGADLAEPMVRMCRKRKPPLPAVVQDACLLGFRPGCFDLVVSLYDSLNYILEAERLLQCFKDVLATLTPQGLFIFDLNTERALSAGLFNQNNIGSNEPLLYSWKADWDPSTRLCRVEMWFNWRGDGRDCQFSETHRQRAYKTRDVHSMLREAGFAEASAFHAQSFRAPTRWSDRVYHVARKE